MDVRVEVESLGQQEWRMLGCEGLIYSLRQKVGQGNRRQDEVDGLGYEKVWMLGRGSRACGAGEGRQERLSG